jgi:hypothetical protein
MKNLGWVLPLLLLAACAEPPPSPKAVLAPPPFPGLAQGIDLPIDARDVSNELKSQQLDFVARYYRDPASRWPTLSAAEAQALSASGVKVVAVWESHSATPSYFSYASGYSDGMAAYGQAKAVGQPAGSAIYFAVDYNAYAQDLTGPIDQYFRGVAAGLIAAAGHAPEYKVGVYGSGAVCYYLKHANLAQYAWLSNSTAWAGYTEFAGWDIRQAGRSPGLSFDQDQNEARGEYGGFRVGSQLSSL